MKDIKDLTDADIEALATGTYTEPKEAPQAAAIDVSSLDDAAIAKLAEDGHKDMIQKLVDDESYDPAESYTAGKSDLDTAIAVYEKRGEKFGWGDAAKFIAKEVVTAPVSLVKGVGKAVINKDANEIEKEFKNNALTNVVSDIAGGVGTLASNTLELAKDPTIETNAGKQAAVENLSAIQTAGVDTGIMAKKAGRILSKINDTINPFAEDETEEEKRDYYRGLFSMQKEQKLASTGATAAPVFNETLESLKEQGAIVSPEAIQKINSASNWQNIVPGMTPGRFVRNVAGRGLMAAGATAETIGTALPNAAKAIARVAGRHPLLAGAGGAGGAAGLAYTLYQHPKEAMAGAGLLAAGAGLGKLGGFVKSAGKELYDPYYMTQGAQKALAAADKTGSLSGRLKDAISPRQNLEIGKAAVRAGIGQSVAGGIDNAAVAALTTDSPEEFAREAAAGVGLGMLSGLEMKARQGSRGMNVETLGKQLATEGRDLNFQTGWDAAHKEGIESISKDEQFAVNKLRGALGRLRSEDGSPIQIYVVNDSAYKTALGDAAGADPHAFTSDDGTKIFVNADARSKLGRRLSASNVTGHEAVHSIEKAIASQVSPKLMDSLISDMRSKLYKEDGTPTPEFQSFILNYNKALGSDVLTPQDYQNAESEFLAETGRAILSGGNIEQFGLPKSIRSSIMEGAGDMLQNTLGIQPKSRKLGFGASEIASVTRNLNNVLFDIGKKLHEETQTGAKFRLEQLREATKNPPPDNATPEQLAEYDALVDARTKLERMVRRQESRKAAAKAREAKAKRDAEKSKTETPKPESEAKPSDAEPKPGTSEPPPKPDDPSTPKPDESVKPEEEAPESPKPEPEPDQPLQPPLHGITKEDRDAFIEQYTNQAEVDNAEAEAIVDTYLDALEAEGRGDRPITLFQHVIEYSQTGQIPEGALYVNPDSVPDLSGSTPESAPSSDLSTADTSPDATGTDGAGLATPAPSPGRIEPAINVEQGADGKVVVTLDLPADVTLAELDALAGEVGKATDLPPEVSSEIISQLKDAASKLNEAMPEAESPTPESEPVTPDLSGAKPEGEPPPVAHDADLADAVPESIPEATPPPLPTEPPPIPNPEAPKQEAPVSDEPTSPLSEQDVNDAAGYALKDYAPSKRKKPETIEKEVKALQREEIMKRHAAALPEDTLRVTLRIDPLSGKEAVSGARFVRGDAAHERLLKDAGLTDTQIEQIYAIQEAADKGQSVDIIYDAADGEGKTGKARKIAQAKSSVAARSEGKGRSKLANESFHLSWINVSKDGNITLYGLNGEHVLGNVEKLVSIMGDESPYKGFDDPQFQSDWSAYVENQRNGYSGRGDRALKGIEGMNAKVNPDYTPTKIDETSADFINMVVGDYSAKGKSERAQIRRDFAEANEGFITPEGETNALRDRLEKEGKIVWEETDAGGDPIIDTDTGEPIISEGAEDVLTRAFANRSPKLIYGVGELSPDAVNLHRNSSGMADLSESGLIKSGYVAAGFMPVDNSEGGSKTEGSESSGLKGSKKATKTRIKDDEEDFSNTLPPVDKKGFDLSGVR